MRAGPRRQSGEAWRWNVWTERRKRQFARNTCRRHRPPPELRPPRSQSSAGGFRLVIRLSSPGVQEGSSELRGSQVNEFLCDLFHRAHIAARPLLGVPGCDIEKTGCTRRVDPGASNSVQPIAHRTSWALYMP